MGQYWLPVNLDKHEFIDPHKLGAGLKLWEQLANHPGTAGALIVLTAAMPEPRGGGDFDVDTNMHGPERVDMSREGPMPDEYPAIAARTIGRWAGDRIALVGDYAEDGDLAPEHKASTIYARCRGEDRPDAFTDITDDVAKVIEHELTGTFTGTGWKDFVQA
jgi:hypothetical protein